MSVVIRVEGLSKKYRLGSINRRMLYHDVQSGLARLLGRPDPNQGVETQKNGRSNVAGISDYLWALRDVSFDVHQGDVVGIIGRNGSGKSTLLKLLSRITAPTEGRVFLKGRIAALLEVGTGFHPELTGRDNIYLNGSILGMTRGEITRKFDEIVDFSGVEKFIDTPVKRYSSGMTVRLAFAVAAHLEPEILVIDEVLAVGDTAFQQKCLGKMNSVAREGRTILFVSHQAVAIENLCTRGIVFEGGRQKFSGSQIDAISYYLSSFGEQKSSLRDRTDRTGSGRVRVVAMEFRNAEGMPVQAINAGKDVDLYLFFENETGHPLTRLTASIIVKTQVGVQAFLQQNRLTGDTFGALPPKGALVCRLKRLPLPPSSYWIDFALRADYPTGELFDSMANALNVHVEGGDYFGTGILPTSQDGVCLVEASWFLAKDEAASARGASVEDARC